MAMVTASGRAAGDPARRTVSEATMKDPRAEIIRIAAIMPNGEIDLIGGCRKLYPRILDADLEHDLDAKR